MFVSFLEIQTTIGGMIPNYSISSLCWKGDVAPYGACRPWIFFINGVFCFLNINGSRMKKEER